MNTIEYFCWKCVLTCSPNIEAAGNLWDLPHRNIVDTAAGRARSSAGFEQYFGCFLCGDTEVTTRLKELDSLRVEMRAAVLDEERRVTAAQ